MNKVRHFFSNNKLKAYQNKNETDIEKFMMKHFVFSGVWKSKNNHTFNSVIAMMNLTVLTMGFLSISYMFILKYNDIDINTEILLHTVEIFLTIFVQLMFIRMKNDVARLSEVFSSSLDQMTLPVSSESTRAIIMEKERKSLLKVMKLAFASIVFVYASVIYDSNAFGIGGPRKLLYPTWFPFETDFENHVVLCYLAVAFQLLIYVELLFIDLAALGLWYGTINIVGGILDILGLTFQTMTDQMAQGTDEYRAELQSKMKSCVDLHNFAMDLVGVLNRSMGLIFMVLLLSSEIAICFCGFHVIQALYTKESSRLLKFFIGVGTFSLVLFVYCASGQKLKNKSEDFFKSLYFSQWYLQSPSFKKSFHLCQTISTKTLVIDGAQFVPADLHTFVNAMKGVFSFLNFLLAIKDKS